MPRNGSGTMTIPNSFTSGTTISSSGMNANFADVGSEITGSLPRDGQAAMTGQLKASTGTAALPSVTLDSGRPEISAGEPALLLNGPYANVGVWLATRLAPPEEDRSAISEIDSAG